VDLYRKVRLACAEGMSQREAARHFNISRDSVAKMMAFSVPPGYRRTAPVKRPKLDAFTGIIDGWLEGDQEVHRKQRHTAKRVFERLRDEHGFTGGYTIVKDYMRERERRGREMFVPLAHPPGHAQADFGEAVVVIAGAEQKAHFFVMDLPHSDGCFVRAYPAATAEAWVDGHTPCLRLLRPGAAVGALRQRPLPGIEDPAGRDAPASDPLQRVPVALPVPRPLRSPRERERQGQRGGTGRLFPPQLHGADPAVCDLGRVQRPSGGAVPHASGRRPAWPVRDDRPAVVRDLAAMSDLPAAPFEACDQATGRVSSQALVRYKTNDYSVPVAYGHRDVWIRGYVDAVVIGCGGEVIARHPRCYDREDMVFDPIHYLPLIERKINALDQAAPLAEWDLPPEFATLRRLMEARMIKAGRREYVQVLRLLETFDVDDLHAAVKKALQLGAVGFDAVKHLVLCQVEKRPPKLDLDVYPYLPRANVATTSAASYMSLLSKDVA
jgi:transposase